MAIVKIMYSFDIKSNIDKPMLSMNPTISDADILELYERDRLKNIRIKR